MAGTSTPRDEKVTSSEKKPPDSTATGAPLQAATVSSIMMTRTIRKFASRLALPSEIRAASMASPNGTHSPAGLFIRDPGSIANG